MSIHATDMTEELTVSLLARIAAGLAGGDERVTYLIGNNGTGKSRVLADLAGVLSLSESEPKVACIASSFRDRFDLTYKGRVQYLGSRTVGNAIFYAAVDRLMLRSLLKVMLAPNGRRRLLRLSMTLKMEFAFTLDRSKVEINRKSIEELRDRASKRRRASTLGLLNVSSQRVLSGLTSGDVLVSSLSPAKVHTLLEFLDLNTEVAVRVRGPERKWMDFASLSTGEQNRALLFAKVLGAAEEETVFLIDEPEISLHLHWQMEFHEVLMRLLEGLEKIHVVVATHAPILISEAARLDPSDTGNAVAVMHRKGRAGRPSGETGPGITPIHYDLHTFAEVASYEHLVLRYFQTAPYQSRVVSEEIADAVLAVAEDPESKSDAVATLKGLLDVKGVNDNAKAHIRTAIRLIQGGTVEAAVAGAIKP